MKKVYILYSWSDSDKNEIVGIYANKELAEEERNLLLRSQPRWEFDSHLNLYILEHDVIDY